MAKKAYKKTKMTKKTFPTSGKLSGIQIEKEVLVDPDDQSGGAGIFVIFGPCKHAILDPTKGPNGHMDNPSVGDWAIKVYDNGKKMRWNIDGEGSGWMLMVKNCICLSGGPGRDKVFDPAHTYTVTYWTESIS